MSSSSTDVRSISRGSRSFDALIGLFAASTFVVGAVCLMFGWWTDAKVGQALQPIAPQREQASDVVPPVDQKAIRKIVWERIQPQLDDTDAACSAKVDESLLQLTEFFAERKQRTPKFAESVLSLRGKWKFAKSKLPFTDSDEHLKYLKESFESQVFSSEELRQTIQSAVESYVSSVEGLENQMLRDIRADLVDLDIGDSAPVISEEEVFRREFRELVVKVTPLVAHDLKVQLAKETALWIASDVAVAIVTRIGIAVAARLGTSAGILAAGGLSTWTTLGIGLVAAIVLDIGLDWFLKKAGFLPEVEIAGKVNETLDGVRAMLADGIAEAHDDYRQLRRLQHDHPNADVRAECELQANRIEHSGCLGLTFELKKLNDLRAKTRREALKRLILDGEGS